MCQEPPLSNHPHTDLSAEVLDIGLAWPLENDTKGHYGSIAALPSRARQIGANKLLARL